MALAPLLAKQMTGFRARFASLLASRWLLLGIVMLAFVLRSSSLTFQSLWRDETDALRFATQPAGQLLAMFSNPGQNGPLYFLGLRAWIALAGRGEFALRFPSVLAGVAAIPLVYVLIRRIAGRTPAVITALLMAVAPYLVWYGQEAKMYAVLTALVPAALLAAIEAARSGRWWRWLLLFVLTSLAFYTHLLAVLIVPVQVIWLFMLGRGRPLRRLLVACGYAVVLFLPYLPLLAWQPSFLRAAPQTGFAFFPLGDMLQVLAVAFSLGVQPARSVLTLLPAMLLLVAGTALPFIQGPRDEAPPGCRRGTALLLVWLWLPPLLLFLVTLRIPLFTDRYMIWIAPAFLALAATGAVSLARAWRPLGLIVLVPLLAFQIQAVIAQSTVPIKSDFRSAAAYVAPRLAQGDVLLYQIPYGRYTFSYYANGRLDPDDPAWQGLDGPYTNDWTAEPVVSAWLDGHLAGAQTIWLIASETSLWDERGLLEQWLLSRSTITDHQAYQHVSVTRYELARP